MGESLHKVWDRLDQNSGFHGNRKRPLTYNGENDVSTYFLLYFIRFFSNLQVTRAGIKSRTSSNFGQIGQLPTELGALSIWNISHRLIMGKWCLKASSFIFYRIFVKLAGNQDRHKISDEFEFRPDRISHFGVTCPWGRIKFSIDIWNLQVQLTFQTLDFFVNLFSGAVRPRRLKRGTNVGSGQMYHVYRNQAAAAYSSLYFSFFFLSNFQYWNFSSHFSQELWGLEYWNLVHTWTVGDVSFILESGCCCLFVSLFLHFSFSPIFNIEMFRYTFLGNCEA